MSSFDTTGTSPVWIRDGFRCRDTIGPRAITAQRLHARFATSMNSNSSRSPTSQYPRVSWFDLGRMILNAGTLPRPRWWPLGVDFAGALASIGAALLFYQWSGARPLWLDEQMIAINLRERGLASLAGPLSLGQSAPFGWLALQRAVILVMGTSERPLRLVPLVFGVGTLATAVWIGRRWMGPIGAAVLVLLCSFGQWLSFYALELKHYSADTFWALFLPALCAWAAESPDDSKDRARRVLMWWTAAAIGQWFANGALLVVPACAAVLLAMITRRAGWRVAAGLAGCGALWLASFGLHYLVAMRHSLASAYLNDYWAFALPPLAGGWSGTLHWLATQFEPFAVKPGGAQLWAMFWLAAASGFVLLMRARPALGLTLAMIPLCALVFAAVRLVPLYERLSLWVVPALYVGIAFSADSSVRRGHGAFVRRNWIALSVAVALASVAFPACSDIVYRGKNSMRDRPFASNHQLDDRTAVRWLLMKHMPGDALITTHLSLPAVWWYGGMTFSNPGRDDSGQPERSPILEAHAATGSECLRATGLREALQGRRRAIVYLGFRFDDEPKGFDDLLLASLRELGTMTAAGRFAELNFAAVFDLGVPTAAPPPIARDQDSGHAPGRANGCLTLRPAARW